MASQKFEKLKYLETFYLAPEFFQCAAKDIFMIKKP